MLEIILLIIVIVLLAFVVIGGIAHQRNQKMADQFEEELTDNPDEQQDFAARYDAVFAQGDDELDVADATVTIDGDRPQPRKFSNVEQEPDLFTELPEEDYAGVVEDVPESEELPELVIALTVMAKADTLFTGRAIQKVFEQQNLRFGDMQIYHRFLANDRTKTVFSIANILDPGTFLPAQMIAMQTPGLLLFSRLPGPEDAHVTLDNMLDCARDMAVTLDGHVCDQQRQPLTDDSVNAIRQQIDILEKEIRQNDSP